MAQDEKDLERQVTIAILFILGYCLVMGFGILSLVKLLHMALF